MKAKLLQLSVSTRDVMARIVEAIINAWKIIVNGWYKLKDFDEERMENLAENAGTFMERCFTIGVDSIFACTIMSIVLSLLNLVRWEISLMASMAAGILCGAIIFGFVTIMAITIYTFIPAEEKSGKRENAQYSRFIRNIKENAYQIVRNIAILEKFVIMIDICFIFSAIIGVTTWGNLAIMLIILTLALFAISGIYLFAKCIIKGVFPCKTKLSKEVDKNAEEVQEEENEDFLDKIEIIISSKGA